MVRIFRVHGDNVVECERTIKLLEKGLGIKASLDQSSSPFHPVFTFAHPKSGILKFELLPGHGRWGVDLVSSFTSKGSLIRENADAVITEIHGESEEVLFGLEYCGALPAGNQAWQRHGRALSFAQSKTPYLIFNDVGGAELDANREVKASRYPNPSAPFAFLQVSRDLESLVLPIYEPSASATEQTRKEFSNIFGLDDATKLMAALILKIDYQPISDSLYEKTLKLVEKLGDSRVKNDSLKKNDWREMLAAKDRFDLLQNKSVPYVRRSSEKVTASSTAAKFASAVTDSGAKSFISSTLPITWVPKSEKPKLLKSLSKIYGNSLDFSFLRNDRDLVITFVTGFKPRGDDSRPDRGLTPLARMLAGPDADLLTFLWGPAKKPMLEKLKDDAKSVTASNGLIEAIVASSDYVLVDSANHSPFVIDVATLTKDRSTPKKKSGNKFTVGEHDVDSVLHFLTTQPNRDTYFEGLCNPPGGDWSGISAKTPDNREIRWTSLPRVSSSSAKRPDHVIQVIGESSIYFLAIESKLNAADMDDNVGPDLKRYLIELMRSLPNAIRKIGDENWQSLPADFVVSNDYELYSAAAFRILKESEMNEVYSKSQADLVIGVRFDVENSGISINLLAAPGKEFLKTEFQNLISSSAFGVEVQE